MRAVHALFSFGPVKPSLAGYRRVVEARIFVNAFADAATAVLPRLSPCHHNKEDQCRSSVKCYAGDWAVDRARSRSLSSFSKDPAGRLRNRIPARHSKIFRLPVRNLLDPSHKSPRKESAASRLGDRELPFARTASWRGDHRDSIQGPPPFSSL